MIDKDLLDILACPETHQPLRMASAQELGALNARIASGKAATRAGKAVGEAVAEGLVREDGRILYPIKEGIPILLIDEGIAL